MVLVDGKSLQGMVNCIKILQVVLDGWGQVVKVEDFMQFNWEDSWELFKGNDVVYIYYNCIDYIGDKMYLEGQVFEVVEQILVDFICLIKKFMVVNVNNLLIIVDYGFIYQNCELDESDFLGDVVFGDDICYWDCCFVLGKGLFVFLVFYYFLFEQFVLDGDMEVQIFKFINWLCLKGFGSCFVYGGVLLQEVVILVLKVNKKCQSDVSVVEVDILCGVSLVIIFG